MAFDRSAIKDRSLVVNGRPMLVANLTDAQIKRALLSGQASALASGWTIANGKIVKTKAQNATTGRPAVAKPAAPVNTGTPAKPGAPAPRPTAPPKQGYQWHYSPKYGKWVQILANAKPATTTPKPLPSIDPRDSTYQAQMAQYGYDRDRSLAEINAQRAQLPSLYNRGLADITTSYNRDRYDSNAELAARGIIRSGEYQRRGADRQMQSARHLSDLQQQYGTGAQSALAQRLHDINQQYNLNQSAALQAAKERYQQANPASQYIWANI